MKNDFISLLNESEKKLNEEVIRLNTMFNGEKYICAEDIDKIVVNIPLKVKYKVYFDFKTNILYYKYNKLYNKSYSYFINFKSNIRKYVNESNDKYLIKIRNKFVNKCLPIEGNRFDFNQVDSVVREDNNILIIAGAGTGKTTTIIGRVKYLINCLNVEPKDILLLSFTNASASEMKDRIEKEIGIDMSVYTFHKFGLDIIRKSLNKNYNVFNKSLSKFIEQSLEEQIKDSKYLSKLLSLFEHLSFLDKDEFDFKNEDEYEEFLTYNPPTTLFGESVKSYGELEIANYLYKNGIKYIYEKEYKIDTTTLEFCKYYPDFYLPEYDIYIEYFGVDENGNVAPYIKGKNGKSGTETYRESMQWKRSVHRNNNTTMIELYYHQFKDGSLLSYLEKKLKKYSVEIKEKDVNELWNEIVEKNNGVLNEIAKLLETVTNLIKSNNYTYDEFKKIILNNENTYDNLVVDILEPIYRLYDKYLVDNGLIDFNDMINNASEFVKCNKYIHDYKYVIVDEYQDISYARYNLLRQLRNQKKYKLFCVGDDFQSIYRFSGSDINLFVDFEKYWGASYIGKIENTYRYTKELADISGTFIMKNPRQMVKHLNGVKSNRYPLSEIIAYTENSLVQFLETKLQELNENSSVFLIGRYTFDITFIAKNKMFKTKYNNATQMVDVEYIKRKDLKITFLTAHKSKGLQADYAIIINNKNGALGFPSKIQDLHIINRLLSKPDNYPYSEERRLFYVAMTRSRIKTILLVLDNKKSIFVKELENAYSNQLKNEKYECPKCGHSLIYKNGKYGSFLGCSNYPQCKYIRKQK